ncbi:hypothetical protein [Nannocystis punicea]|uniref:Uncharacterized protein n=1 Tax=Nannocystis punicea TaxID=2995304 RepID=A0ABY7H280_9BACT|nr:hypothetical protein [Nannocystis poenicansa]WAS93357.1 hypothetical protein O0S08_45005 [Nannocystis poenicansa]
MKYRHAVAGLVCSLLLHESSGCERGCGEGACRSGYTVSFTSGSAWAQGDYRFSIDIDGQVVTCEGSLPLDPSCETASSACDPEQIVFLDESGCALPDEEQSFPAFSVYSTDISKVGVKVWHEDVLLADVVLTPEFAVEQPNGEGCPPTCTQAYDEIVF